MKILTYMKDMFLPVFMLLAAFYFYDAWRVRPIVPFIEKTFNELYISKLIENGSTVKPVSTRD